MGNVRQLTNSSGAITDTYEYDAFGNKIASTGTTPNNYLYRGEQWDPDLSLYYLRARYYNPLTGRFMSRDSVSGIIKVPLSLHKYLYADGDPINGIDPTGKADIMEYLGETSEKLNLYNTANGPNRSGQCIGQKFSTIAMVLGEALTNPAKAVIDSQGVALSTESCVRGSLESVLSPVPESPKY